jgi:competence protein ComEC
MVKLLIETSSAQLMTVPIVMYIFGQVSLIALVANLLVVPLVPLAMLLSTIAGFAGMLVPAFAGLVAWPARMVLSFMLDVSGLLARIPHALSEVKITAGLMVVSYAAVVAFVIILRRRSPRLPEYAKIEAE